MQTKGDYIPVYIALRQREGRPSRSRPTHPPGLSPQTSYHALQGIDEPPLPYSVEVRKRA